MHTLRARAISALLVIVAIAFGAVASAAATTDLLVGHGNFEKPVVPNTAPHIGKTFTQGAVFDGWKVQANKVSLIPAVAGLIVPPQGKQALTLDDALAQPGDTLKPGAICRSVPTLAKHRYNVAFKAAIGNSGTAQVIAKLGTTSKAVALPPGSVPAVFKPYKVTLQAASANAQLCMAAAKLSPKSFPTIDALTVTDLGL